MSNNAISKRKKRNVSRKVLNWVNTRHYSGGRFKNVNDKELKIENNSLQNQKILLPSKKSTKRKFKR